MRMLPETFRCPHCGARYEIKYDRAVSDDSRLALSNLRKTDGGDKRLEHSALRTRQNARWHECLDAPGVKVMPPLRLGICHLTAIRCIVRLRRDFDLPQIGCAIPP